MVVEEAQALTPACAACHHNTDAMLSNASQLLTQTVEEKYKSRL